MGPEVETPSATNITAKAIAPYEVPTGPISAFEKATKASPIAFTASPTRQAKSK